MRYSYVLASLALATSALAAFSCGGGKASDPASVSPKAGSANDADGGSAASGAGGADAAPPPRPFAGSATEATQLIGAAVDKKAPDVQKCIVEYRTRKNLPHERVTISMGIDQEGRLLGATLPKGKADTTLSDCLQKALGDAAFPRSHSGVISITKSYEEIFQ